MSERFLTQPGRVLGPCTIVKAGDNVQMPNLVFERSLPPIRINLTELADVKMNAGNSVLYRTDDSRVDQTGYLFRKDSDTFPKSPGDFKKALDERNVLLSYNGGWRNYFHVMTQCGFSAWLLSNFFADLNGVFVAPALGMTFRQVLKLLDVSEADTVLLSKTEDIAFRKAFIIDTTYTTAPVMPSTLMPLYAGDLMRAANIRSTSEPIKVYVSRRDSKKRALLNEEQIEEELKKQGFQVHTLAKLSLPEQMTLFNSADLIVAPHGAGLSNLIFCRPGTKVLELMPNYYINPCFMHLSQVLNLKHTTQVFHNPIPPDVTRHLHSWTADVDAVMSCLRELQG